MLEAEDVPLDPAVNLSLESPGGKLVRPKELYCCERMDARKQYYWQLQDEGKT